MYRKITLLFILFCLSSVAAQAIEYKKLDNIRVVDGDTLKGTYKGQKEYIRILRIDCHETSYNSRADFQHKLYNLPYDEIYRRGQKEKEYLQSLIDTNRNYIFFEDKGKDKYNRTLAEVYIGKKINISDLMLNNKVCPIYVRRH